jgi:uncharacterized membrane protein
MLKTILLSAVMGTVAGLRTMTAPAAASWATRTGRLPREGQPFTLLGHRLAPGVLTALALGEFVGDQLPSTPSRKAPLPFAARIASGALSGGAVGAGGGQSAGGAIAGAIGAAVGTIGGYAARSHLAEALGNDRPAAFIEDAAALLGALIVVRSL